ncbi:hypothetical protein ESA94_18155 [Lacibacter luteus]|uniref:Uncharacterized protein n=1 Tax=Lacibacter luteus TaxID=2508719 RepID=A0A4Q1CFA1_9BACT|nr:hypothetical protein [Lacibacter luteus]RXK58555.1 hypothetical protein ESA94_18155 [Lacibacter luteus]
MSASSRSLTKSNRLFSGVGYYGNFLNSPVKIGDIFQVDGNEHIKLGNIQQLTTGISIKEFIEQSNEANFKFTSGKSFEINFGVNAELKLAKGEVLINFKSNSSAFVSLNDAKVSVLSIGMIEDKLKAYWKSKGYDQAGNRRNYIIVSSVIESVSGTVIFSEEKNNKVVLKASTDEEIKSIKALGSGQFEYVSNTKATLEIISPKTIQPLYRALWIRANGKFDIVS